ncbi:hypothetical protein SAMN05421770_11717 [Granulicella rosea]|uniref:Uncharacterized protein n=1 Tax=Granulicella rosea TaxID=474952 RepID=A0A239MPJ5_9BACT|nr:hypothetical protein [Granulicella rosea]SNT44024.1 hypothetical protein SAMN05421770_11717 [Granulicella rosea]
MAKTKYNPMNAFREDPLAALRQATESADARDVTDAAEARPIPAQPVLRRIAASEPPSSEPVAPQPPIQRSSAPVKPLSANLQTSRNTVYLYPEDLTKLRQLSGYASTEYGIRANDSMIVRAALSLLETDVRFLHALKETELLDRRRRSRA